MSRRPALAEGHAAVGAVARLVEALSAPATVRHLATAAEAGGGGGAPLQAVMVLHGPAAARLIAPGIDGARTPKAYVDAACLAEASFQALMEAGEAEVAGHGLILSIDPKADTDLDFSGMFSGGLHFWAQARPPGGGVECVLCLPEPAWIALHLAETHGPGERVALAQLMDACGDAALGQALNRLRQDNPLPAAFRAASHFLDAMGELAVGGRARAAALAAGLDMPSGHRAALKDRLGLPPPPGAGRRRPRDWTLDELLEDVPLLDGALAERASAWEVERSMQWLAGEAASGPGAPRAGPAV